MNNLISIREFLTNDYYLGKAWKDNSSKSILFEYWRNILSEKFKLNHLTTDLETHYNSILLTGGRGTGKSKILNEAIAPYFLYLLLNKHDIEMELNKLDSKESKKDKLTFCFLNCNKICGEQAKDKFIKAVESSSWFQHRLGSFQKLYDYIDIIVATSENDLKDRNIACCFMDEGRKRSGSPYERERLYKVFLNTMRSKGHNFVFAIASSQTDCDKNINDLILKDQKSLSSWVVYANRWLTRPELCISEGSLISCSLILGSHLERISPKLLINRESRAENAIVKTVYIPSSYFSHTGEYKSSLAYDFDQFLMDFVGFYPYLDSMNPLKEDELFTCSITQNGSIKLDENEDKKIENIKLPAMDIENLQSITNIYFEELNKLYKAIIKTCEDSEENDAVLNSLNNQLQTIREGLLDFLKINIPIKFNKIKKK